MRKALLVICIAALLSAIVSAKTTITVWTFFSGGEGFIVTDLIKKFNAENPDIEVVEQIVEWGELYNKLTTAVVAGDPPDVSVMHLAMIPDFASRGALTPIDAYASKDILSDYVPEIISKAHYNNKLYAIPIDTHPLVMYYNKKLLKKAGLVDQNGEALIPKTWDELIKYAKTAKEKLGLEVSITAENGPMVGERLFMAYYTQLGGEFYDAKTNSIKLDLEKAKKTYEFIKGLYDSGIIKSMDYNTAESLFQNDQSVFHLNGVWAMAVYPTLNLEFGVTSVPALEGSKPYTWADSHTWVLPKHPKDDPNKIKAAVKFIEWFARNAAEWAKAGHLPVLNSVLKSDAFLSLPMRKDYAQVANFVVPAPSMKGWVEIRQKMWEISQSVILGETSAEQAAKQLQQAIKDVLAD
ncbi:MAG TPA: ABC transporter substrate-binding protein [Pseudothermotoga sp.]|nr:ABC transporter substrate-binding protein [Pseudothermotoga sp.]HOK83479.1 ABC transporter substrate-binding protein [Pseudothermotoga sp.]HPP69552.1 ABC transporter substrate-binding protein [Pseudothermotoga sp.]